MKTKTILVAVMMMMGVAVANAQSLAVAKQAGTNVFRIIYKDDAAGKVKLNVLDAQGELVFSETHKVEKGFVRPLNFSGMEQGEYTIEVAGANEKKSETINYVVEPSLKNVHVAKIEGESKYLLAVTGSDVINVRIFNSANELVFDEDKKTEQGFAQVYNLKNLTGSFTFEVSDMSGNTKTIRF